MRLPGLSELVRVSTAATLVAGGLWFGIENTRPDQSAAEPAGAGAVTAEQVRGRGPDTQVVDAPDGANFAEDVRILLLRSYVPADGRMAIDADPPEITIVQTNERTGRTRSRTLPDCPTRITSARVLTDLFDDTQGRTPGRQFADMAKGLGLPNRNRGPFPYCSWWARINTSVYETRDYDNSTTPVQDGMNIFLPDSDATYWAVPFDASQEPNRRGWALDHITINGKYQEQLFMSYVLYDSSMDFYYYENDAGTVCASYNTDYQIDPDPGSVNPWQDVNTDYDDTYSLDLVLNPQGTNCSGGGPGEHKTQGSNFNVLPLSRTDSGYGPDDDDLDTSSRHPIEGDFFGPDASDGVSRASNGCFYFGADATPCTLPGMFVAPTSRAQSSVWSNPVAGYLASGFIPLPDFVYVFRGKAPRTPQGSSPVPWADSDLPDYDMRYFSLCVDKKIWPFPAQDANWSCANGSFGSGEYDAGTNPDGLTRLNVGDDGYWTVIVTSADLSDSDQVGDANVLQVAPGVPVAFIMRHMVVQDNFTTSVPFTTRDGAWPTAYNQLGDYYPVETTICNEGQFESRGWQNGACFVPPVSSE